MSQIVATDVECPGSTCPGGDVVFQYSPVYAVGSVEPQAAIFDGARCETCDLQFINDDVLDRYGDLEPPLDEFCAYDK